MSELVVGLLTTAVFTFMLIGSSWILVERRRIGLRPIEHLARTFRRARRATSVSVVPSRYRRLSPEMVKEMAAAHGLRFDGEYTHHQVLRLRFSPAPAPSEGAGDDR